MDLGYNTEGRSQQQLIHPELMIYSLSSASSFLTQQPVRHLYFCRFKAEKCRRTLISKCQKVATAQTCFCFHLLTIEMAGIKSTLKVLCAVQR